MMLSLFIILTRNIPHGKLGRGLSIAELQQGVESIIFLQIAPKLIYYS